MTSNFQTPPNTISHKSAHFPFYQKTSQNLDYKTTKTFQFYHPCSHLPIKQGQKSDDGFPLNARDTARCGSQQAALTTAVFSARVQVSDEPVPFLGTSGVRTPADKDLRLII